MNLSTTQGPEYSEKKPHQDVEIWGSKKYQRRRVRAVQDGSMIDKTCWDTHTKKTTKENVLFTPSMIGQFVRRYTNLMALLKKTNDNLAPLEKF